MYPLSIVSFEYVFFLNFVCVMFVMCVCDVMFDVRVIERGIVQRMGALWKLTNTVLLSLPSLVNTYI